MQWQLVKFKKEIREVGGDGKDNSYRISLPKEAVEDALELEKGDSIAVLWNTNYKQVKLKRHPKDADEEEVPEDEAKTLEKKPLTQRIGLQCLIIIALVGFSFPFFSHAYAQTEPANSQVPAPPYQTPTTQSQVPVLPAIIQTKTFPNINLPARLEITFPTGNNATYNVGKLALSSVYTDLIQSGSGITTHTFNVINSSDTFTITFGDKYTFQNEQVVNVVVYSNNTQLMSETFPIHSNQFFDRLVLTTHVPPHIPTPDELNAGVYSRIAALNGRIDGMTQAITTHDAESHETNRQLGLASRAYLVTILPNLIIAVVGTVSFLGLVIFVRRQSKFGIQKPQQPAFKMNSDKKSWSQKIKEGLT